VQQRFCRQNLGQQPPFKARPWSNQALTKYGEHGADFFKRRRSRLVGQITYAGEAAADGQKII
jgi:hypothetical protein